MGEKMKYSNLIILAMLATLISSIAVIAESGSGENGTLEIDSDIEMNASISVDDDDFENESIEDNETDDNESDDDEDESNESTEEEFEEESENGEEKIKIKIKQKIQEKEQEFEFELENKSSSEKEVLKNQNKVRIAVHALLEAENLTGIGKNVSQIAREFNNSVSATIQSEEKIKTRSTFVRFFVGGDEDAAKEIQCAIERNNERIQKLTQLIEACNCSVEFKEAFRIQLKNMGDEQERLKIVVDN